jgi:hypothetical protein
MMDLFVNEIESQTTPCDNYRKHGETLFKYSIAQPNTIRLIEYIAFNPRGANKTGQFLCQLADKYNITMIGKAEPFWVGPSATKKEAFFKGMNLQRLLKWYEYYGFKILKDNKIIREPK